jgi:hypothetical protein
MEQRCHRCKHVRHLDDVCPNIVPNDKHTKTEDFCKYGLGQIDDVCQYFEEAGNDQI